MKIIHIAPRGFSANSYIITEDGEQAIIIDPSQARVESELIKHGLKPTAVLLTHCHFDHVGGVAALQASGARVYCSEQEKPLVGTSADLFSAFGVQRVPYQINDTFFDGEEKILNGISVTALVTPGHTLGSCCYLITAKDGGRYLFTGDTLFAGNVGRMDFPTGDITQMRASLRRLSKLEGDIPVYPGHNEETTLDFEKKTNPYMCNL